VAHSSFKRQLKQITGVRDSQSPKHEGFSSSIFIPHGNNGHHMVEYAIVFLFHIRKRILNMRFDISANNNLTRQTWFLFLWDVQVYTPSWFMLPSLFLSMM